MINYILKTNYNSSPHIDEDIDEEYKNAMLAGLNRANCDKTFPTCDIGYSLLDNISILR